MEVEEKPKGGFLPSKWETIDKTELEAQGEFAHTHFCSRIVLNDGSMLCSCYLRG